MMRSILSCLFSAIFLISCTACKPGIRKEIPNPPKEDKKSPEIPDNIEDFDIFENVDSEDITKNVVKAKNKGIEKILESNIIVKRTRGDDGHCAGTIVKSRKRGTLILTACHCIMEDDSRPMKFGFVDTGKETYRFIVKKYSRKHDLALLKVTDRMPIYKVGKLSKNAPRVGDDIWLVGFGAGVDDVLSNGIVSKLNQKSHYGAKVQQIQVVGWYGSSGGALYNDSFELSGVCIEFGPQGGAVQGWMYAVSYDIVKNFLKNL